MAQAAWEAAGPYVHAGAGIGAGIAMGAASPVVAAAGAFTLAAQMAPVVTKAFSGNGGYSEAGVSLAATFLIPIPGAGKAAASVEKALLRGEYGALKQIRPGDAHHIIQDAAVRDIPHYNRNLAPAVKLSGPSTQVGSSHYLATQVQSQMGGGTYSAERRIAYKALRKAGIERNEARDLIYEADEYFKSIGVNQNTATRIPGNRK